MKNQLYYGNLKKCTYLGYAGNFFGVDHDEIIEQGVYFVKLKEHEYIRLEELLSDKKKKETLKDDAKEVGQLFVGDLVLVNDLVETKIHKK